jgi:hypothetical protein
MSDFIFVVPSYKRAKTFATKTLSTLNRNGVDTNDIYCFLSDENELSEYKDECEKVGLTPHIIPSVKTLAGNRNFIVNYFPEGTKLVWCDDDLDKIMFRKDEKTLVECTNFKEHIQTAFRACEKEGSYIWGIYAASNPYFMKDNIGKGLYYIIGSCYGTINRHSDVAYVGLEDKEDFERTLKYYSQDGVVLRINYLTVSSAYYKEPGGMQETRTEQRIDESAKFLESKYPDLCTYYIRKTTGHAELRLRDKRLKVSSNTLDAFF